MKYVRKVENLTTGSSLGNLLMFARFDPETNLEGLWRSTDNRFYCGRWQIDFFINEQKLKASETIFEPLSQETKYVSDTGNLLVRKFAFLPYVGIENFDKFKSHLDKFFYVIEVENQDTEPKNLKISHNIILPAVDSPFFTKQPSSADKEKKFKIFKRDRGFEIEANVEDEKKRFLISNFEFNEINFNETEINASQIILLNPNEKIKIFLLFSLDEFVDYGDIEILFNEILQISNFEIESVLGRTFIFTPNKTINSGIQWAKVNLCRVEHLYKIGFAFTNDPPQDIVVMRDLAWFVLGSDYVTPKFSHEMLKLALKYGIHPDGKVTEYIHADETNPILYDYKLNINDDTPLLIWALYHHLMLCDEENLSENYNEVKKIADYILTQIKDGLVFSSAGGTGVYGITGWRNIIENYNLSGFVTEINSECIYALEIVSKLADKICNKSDAEKYKTYARSLRENFYSKLISDATGLPLLNIDSNGIQHHDITGDLVFPLLFEVVDEDLARKISDRLLQPDIWTEFGARTVSRYERNYDPDFGFQLVGGVWPNLTAWIGYGVRKFYPEKVAESLLNIYRVIEAENPSNFQNLVPGEFPERFNGENFKSRGMTLSPWMPPTYIWLAVEGLLGFSFEFEKIKMKPSLPKNWKWIAVKNLPYRNGKIDAFIFDDALYISGVKIDNVDFDGEVIEIVEDNSESVKVNGAGNLFCFRFKVLSDTSEYVFVATDTGFNGKIEVDGKIYQLKLESGEGVMLNL